MLFAHRWIAVALCLLLSGCSVCKNARRTLCAERRAYSWKDDRARSKEIYRYWADEAWGEHCAAFPEVRCAESYAYGFKDGFVDFVYAGGTGEPPPVPPRRFWNADLRSPNGHEGANGWFEGYREGARIARNGGFREQAKLLPSFRLGAVNEVGFSRNLEIPTTPIEKLEPQLESLPPPVLETPKLDNPLPQNPFPQNDSAEQRPSMPENLSLASQVPVVHHMLPLNKNATSLQPKDQRNSRHVPKKQKEDVSTNREHSPKQKHGTSISKASYLMPINPSPQIKDQRVIQIDGFKTNHPTPHRKPSVKIDPAAELQRIPPVDHTTTSLRVVTIPSPTPEKTVNDHSLPDQELNTIELEQINQGSSFNFVY